MMLRLAAAIAAFFFATAASGQIQQGPQTPYDSLLPSYFVNFVCGDGSLPALNPSCGWLNAQKASDPIRWQRVDWGSDGNPWYYVSDSAVSDNGQFILQPWLAGHQAPYFNPPNDGGQTIVTDGWFARFASTEDGGYPSQYWFTGPGCGGTGWTIVDARMGIPRSPSWAASVATLGNSQAAGNDPNSCPPMSQALTRWQIANVSMPWQYYNNPMQWVSIPTIISEHYSGADPNAAPGMERFFLGLHYGEILWESWTRTPSNLPMELAQRCLGYSIQGESGGGWFQPTGGTWYLNDCRQYTHVIAVPAGAYWTYDQLGWPNPPPVYR
jgi:hypothetical protein